MKKFTNMKEDVIKDSDSSIENTLFSIIESSLNIKVDGDLDSFLSKNIEIDGKETLIESIKELINSEVNNSIKSVMESVKYQGIEHVSGIFEAQTAGDMKKHTERVNSLLDKDDVEKHAKRQANSIKGGEKSFYRAIAAEQLISEKPERKKDLKKIHDIFLFRSKQLGYKK